MITKVAPICEGREEKNCSVIACEIIGLLINTFVRYQPRIATAVMPMACCYDMVCLNDGKDRGLEIVIDEIKDEMIELIIKFPEI